MTAYYNEFDPFAAAWLRNLIAAEAIPPGEVDERSIADVQPTDLAGFQQCHFFCGIAGWPLALRLAGWPDDRPVWTGSCPCQPFSAAGKRGGQEDERHLWPEFFRLIQACRPPVIFGEQVASADVVGKAGGRSRKPDQPVWLDGVFADLEGARYTCGAADLPAASVGSPHIRQRLFWVAQSSAAGCEGSFSESHKGRSGPGVCREPDGLADAKREQHERRGVAGFVAEESVETKGQAHQRERCGEADCDCGAVGRMADAERDGRRIDQPERGPEGRTADRWSDSGAEPVADGNCERLQRRPESYGIEEQPGQSASRRGNSGGCGGSVPLADATCERAIPAQQPGQRNGAVGGGSGSCELGESIKPRLERHARDVDDGDQPGRIGADTVRPAPEAGVPVNLWSDYRIIACRDGKARRIGREVFPLADGIPNKRSDPRLGWLLAELGRLGHSPASARAVLRRARANRTGRLKGLGNAIVPQVAAEFVRAWMEITEVLQ